jgi:hypothetical protein
MQRLVVSGAVRPIYGSLGVRGLIQKNTCDYFHYNTPAGITRSFHFQVKAMENHYDLQNCYKQL